MMSNRNRKKYIKSQFGVGYFTHGNKGGKESTF